MTNPVEKMRTVLMGQCIGMYILALLGLIPYYTAFFLSGPTVLMWILLDKIGKEQKIKKIKIRR